MSKLQRYIRRGKNLIYFSNSHILDKDMAYKAQLEQKLLELSIIANCSMDDAATAFRASSMSIDRLIRTELEQPGTVKRILEIDPENA